MPASNKALQIELVPRNGETVRDRNFLCKPFPQKSSNLLLQLAPSVEHQAKAMLDLLIRYKWHQFAIITTKMPGHADFIQSIRDRILELQQVLR